MKTLDKALVVGLLVGLFLLSLLINWNANLFNTNHARLMAALDWSSMAIGVAIAAVGAFRLLQLGLQGAKLPQVMPAAVALFAGLTLWQRFWAIPISFAAVLICWMVVDHLKPSERKPEE